MDDLLTFLYVPLSAVIREGHAPFDGAAVRVFRLSKSFVRQPADDEEEDEPENRSADRDSYDLALWRLFFVAEGCIDALIFMGA